VVFLTAKKSVKMRVVLLRQPNVVSLSKREEAVTLRLVKMVGLASMELVTVRQDSTVPAVKTRFAALLVKTTVFATMVNVYVSLATLDQVVKQLFVARHA